MGCDGNLSLSLFHIIYPRPILYKWIAESFYTLTSTDHFDWYWYKSSLDTKLLWIWIHKKQNKIHYIILLVIVAKLIISLREKM